MIQSTSNETLCGMMPHARQYTASVVSVRELAHHTYAVRIDSAELAKLIIPGQFFMIRPAKGTDPTLGRPFALYDTILNEHGEPIAFEFAFHVVGKMTSLMSQWAAGVQVQLWGPLGNGFPMFQGKHLLCVGGGIGYTPFLAVSREALGLRSYGANATRKHAAEAPRVSFVYGVQTKEMCADLSDFADLTNLSTYLTTDDGSEGRKGFVTEVVKELLAKSGADRPDGVYCCGPEPMMHAVAAVCHDAGVDCWLSLETPMACGFGACFSCVTKVRDDSSPDGWDYRRTCIEGPIFPAQALVR
ncbi:dihydroorotate dehydrogenase electron transfer subunit [Planctomicrobium sp. SH668]|uniref:dihydroorotate dehydrogenase electron transfer subunit n=1 Tax=Planctomicrobium sp. SH668 TaxID=3448126 RepID=UPI003F5CABF3